MRRILIVLCLGVAAVAGCRDDNLTNLAGGIAGVVCDPLTGRPAPGAQITASFVNQTTKKAATKSATADASGFFKLGGLPVEKVDLHVEVADTFQNDIKGVDVAALKDAQLTDPACGDHPQQPGTGAIIGQICNRHTGNYITNGTVTVLLADGTQLSTQTNDADGSFRLDNVPEGDQIVYVRGDGFQKTFRVTVVADTETELDQRDITCTPYDALTTGKIKGQICGEDANGVAGPLGGARVFVVTDLGDGNVYEDETLDDGTFTIAGIPTSPAPPPLQVRAEKGGFVFTWDNVIVTSIQANPDGTDLTATSGCQTLQPDDQRKYLVVQGVFDRIEHVLQRMGVQPTLVDGNPVDFSDWTTSAFGTKEELETYDAVFINCGADESPFELNGLNATVKNNIKEYVQGGGSLYVSDWAYDIVEQVWPEKINFLGNDLDNSAAEHGAGEQVYHARVLEPGLQDYIGADTVDVDFLFDNFAVVSEVAPGVTTYLQADEKYHVNGGQTTLPNTPMTVGFNDGLGRVIFTSFHQEQDASQLCTAASDCSNGLDCIDGACTAQLDDAQDQVLRYLIFSL